MPFDAVSSVSILSVGCMGLSFGCENDHLCVLHWVRESGCLWNAVGRIPNLWRRRTVKARYGRLGVLQWARDKDCPWDEMTCRHAAQNDRLEVLQWARENGCPLDEWTRQYVALNGL